MGKVLKITAWALSFFFVLDACLNMISAANSIQNICGVFLLVIMIDISVKTKCFTKLKNKSK